MNAPHVPTRNHRLRSNGAFMGYRILVETGGAEAHQQWHGYLANVEPDEYEEKFAEHLPDSMLGSEFLARYGGTTDTVTKVEPDRTYAIRSPTMHPIYENYRVRQFARLLQGSLSQDEMITLGKLMYESHDSYSACGLGSMGGVNSGASRGSHRR